MKDATVCPRGYKLKNNRCTPIQKFISCGIHEDAECLALPVGNLKYIAFGLMFGERPRIRGLTVPLTPKELKETFDIDI